jgi:thymidylate kinase
MNVVLSRWLAPPPGLVVLLDAPGELMFARKGEHTPELLEQRRQAYRSIVGHFPHAVVLDASRPLEEVTRRAVAAVWQRFTELGTARTEARR